MGELSSRNAADALIEVLSKAQLPEMKIEALIGLGKLKEVRAVYLMEQLTNDPHEGVAFTASEILLKLEKETGIKGLITNLKVFLRRIFLKRKSVNQMKDRL